jgi:site-specific DNA-adenine methylase
MISYYGSKGKIVKKYPKPKHNKIREPFAGSGKYALEYYENDVILVEKYNVLFRVWKFLQQASPKDILSLPRMKAGESTDSFTFDCQEAKWLMGFIVNQGSSSPKKSVSKVFGGGKMEELIEREKKRIAANLFKIRHWQIIEGDYSVLPNEEATYFVDPPYMYGGEYYHSSVNNKHIDYVALAAWCKSRKGQVIVCENDKADWMDFQYLTDLSGSKNRTREVMWYREENNV